MKNKIYSLFAMLVFALAAGMQEASAQTASSYTTDIGNAATQLTLDVNTVIPLALGVAIVIFGVGVVWRTFKRISRSG